MQKGVGVSLNGCREGCTAEHLLVGFSVCRLQLSNNAVHKYACTTAICQCAFFRMWGKLRDHLTSQSLTSREKMHENSCIYRHLAFSTRTFQISWSLVSTERVIFFRVRIGLQQAGNWIKLWEVPSQHCFTAVYLNRFLQWVQRKKLTLTFLSKTQDLPSLPKQNEPVRLLTSQSNKVYAWTKKYFSTNKKLCQLVSSSSF